MSARAAASWPRSHNRSGGCPCSAQSAAACSIWRRARSAVEAAVIASASGGQADRNASWATPTTTWPLSRSVVSSRRATKASSSAATGAGSSSRRTRHRVGRPCSSTVTSRNNSLTTCSRPRPLAAVASARAASAWRASAPCTPPSCSYRLASSRPPRPTPSASWASV